MNRKKKGISYQIEDERIELKMLWKEIKTRISLIPLKAFFSATINNDYIFG